MLNNKFYSYSAVTSNGDELILGRIGANDPDFNLRNEPTLIIRKKNAKNTVFAAIIESHGTYNPVSELAINAYSTIKNIEVIYDTVDYTAVQFENNKGDLKIFILSNINASTTAKHKLKINDKSYEWSGSYYFK